MVVAGGTARGKGVAQPEAVLQRDAVGDVAERGGALVGGDHQIGVVTVMAHSIGRVFKTLGREIVAEFKYRSDEGLVAGDAVRHDRIAITAYGRAHGNETALGANRHNDRVLDLLRLDQAQDLGAEILAPVRPADAAARHLAAAQVNALHLRAVDENLGERARRRQVDDLGGIELEGEPRLRLAGRIALVMVGAPGAFDDIEKAADDAVFVQALHRFQQGGNLALHPGNGGGPNRIGQAGVEARLEQRDQQAGNAGMSGQRAFHILLAERYAGLAQVLGDGAQDHHLAPIHVGQQDQPVKAVTCRLSVPDGEERRFQPCLGPAKVNRLALAILQLEIVDDRTRPSG